MLSLPHVKTAPPTERLPSLDGLRAVCISLVLVAHGSATFPSAAHLPFLDALYLPGEVGVLAFFVLSGFLITTLLLKELHRTETIALRKFYSRRSYRLLPVFYAYMAVVAVLMLGSKVAITGREYIAAFCFLNNYGFLFYAAAGKDVWYIGHFWTLACEQQFYLFWPPILLWLKPGRAVYFAFFLLLAAPVLRTAGYFLFPAIRDYTGIMLHTRVDSMMIGCLLALIYKTEKFRSVWQRLAGRPSLLTLPAGLIVASCWIENREHGTYLLPIGWSVENICIAVLLVWIVQSPDTFVGKALNSRLLVHVGAISYSLYIWQQLFLTPSNTTITGKFPVNILCVVLVSEASFFLIERPFSSLRRKREQNKINLPPVKV